MHDHTQSLKLRCCSTTALSSLPISSYLVCIATLNPNSFCTNTLRHGGTMFFVHKVHDTCHYHYSNSDTVLAGSMCFMCSSMITLNKSKSIPCVGTTK